MDFCLCFSNKLYKDRHDVGKGKGPCCGAGFDEFTYVN
jgi:hypothetical protein